MSTVAIRWPDVVAVHSQQRFIVEDNAGGRYVGTLSTDDQRRISIGGGARTTEQVDLPAVTRIAPGESTFRNRLGGSFSLGIDYAKASDIATVSTASTLTYRAPAFGWTLSFDANSTKDQEIVKDFYLDLSVYQSYDSDPPDASADKDDYGVTSSLGYSFD